MAGIEIELAVGRSEVIHAFELNVPGPHAKFEIFEVAQGVEGGRGFQGRVTQQ
ncbi:hypothetical protein D3C73_1509990 [compost metagenome]